MFAKSVKELAIILKVFEVASSSKFNKNFSLVTNIACIARSPNFSISSFKIPIHLFRIVS
jgi:hypothetical protein